MAFFDYFVAEDAYLALAKIQGGLSQGSVTGTTYWVDSSNSNPLDASGRGTFTAPYATIDYAINATTANKGDVVLVMPGHTETISSGAAIDLDVASTSIVGLGYGTFRPTVTLDNTASTVEINAAGCRIENLRFSNAVSALANCIAVTANGDGAHIVGCEFTLETPSTDEIDDVILIAAADDVMIAKNRFNFAAVGSPYCDTVVKNTAATNRLSILGNYMAGGFAGTGVIHLAGAASADILIAHNWIYNNVAAAAVSLVNSTTGFVTDNRGYSASANAILPFDSCCCTENYFTSNLTLSGTIDPAIA